MELQKARHQVCPRCMRVWTVTTKVQRVEGVVLIEARCRACEARAGAAAAGKTIADATADATWDFDAKCDQLAACEEEARQRRPVPGKGVAE